MIKIEKGVPPPKPPPKFKKYLEKLGAGESFVVFDEAMWTVLRNAISSMHRDSDMRFVTKKVRERHPKTRQITRALRVWRKR